MTIGTKKKLKTEPLGAVAIRPRTTLNAPMTTASAESFLFMVRMKGLDYLSGLRAALRVAILEL